MDKARRTLTEMALQSLEMEIGTGRGICCPACGCRDLRTYKTNQGHASTFRYKQCRNCGHKMFTMQPPEQIVRSVGEEQEEENEGDLL